MEPGSKSSNSSQQFVAALNGKFETAENLLHKNYRWHQIPYHNHHNIVGNKHLKQTKLSNGYFYKKPQTEGRFNTTVLTQKAPQNSEYFLLPLPKSKVTPSVKMKGSLNRTIDVVVKHFHGDYLNVQGTNSPLKEHINSFNNRRNKMALMGGVDFCLKIHKVYPTLDALWDVYGLL